MMTLAKIHPKSRGLLRLHGWLFLLWVAAVGIVVNLLLVHLFHLQLRGVRYALGAGAVYFLGFVAGGWYYLRWWNAQPATNTGRPIHSTQEDELAYIQQEEALGKKFEWLRGFEGLGGGGDDPLSALILVISLLAAGVGLIFLVGYFPWLTTEALGDYLAEIMLEFVIGAVVLRRVVKPRTEDDYWAFMVRKTWLGGLLLVTVAAAVGFMMD